MPGQVSLDLLAAGIIEEPYKGFNDVLQQWIASDNWTYTRDAFSVPDDIISADVRCSAERK